MEVRMEGVSFTYDKDSQFLTLTLNPGEFESDVSVAGVKENLNETPYKDFYISDKALKSACDKANHHFKTSDDTSIQETIAERRHAEIDFVIAEDNLSATLHLTTPYGGKLPTATSVKNLAYKSKIRRGIGIKRIQRLLEKAQTCAPGTVLEEVIAKGLPPKDGKNSRFIPLVPNALERVLRPQNQDGSSRIDLRNLGEVICVKAGTNVLRRTSPTKGRRGFDVRGNVLDSTSGEWQDFRIGSGTAVSDSNENLLVATLSGMPKYRDLTMNIDDTFICSGVNVGSGHVTYDGSVLVNGDVTERMQIKATGDVTVSGFVESARIEAGGDIIVTEGAMGKVNDNASDYGCQLIAGGNIFVQHGQGLEIQCSGSVNVGRQLAYSRLKCGSTVIVGQAERPMGNLFACEIICQDKVEAGTLGAVSGSTLKVDFSVGYNLLIERKDNVDELIKQLRENNLRHKEKIDLITKKLAPNELKTKINEAVELFKNEMALLNWLELKANELKQAKDDYHSRIKLIAHKRIYQGVTAKLNNRNWRSEREHDRSIVHYEDHQWHYSPMV